jgi:hypothetical protein
MDFYRKLYDMIRNIIEMTQREDWRDMSQAVDIAKGGLQRPHTWVEFINWYKRRRAWLKK